MIATVLVGTAVGLAVSPVIALTASAAAHRPTTWRRLWPPAAVCAAAVGTALAAAALPAAVTAALALAGIPMIAAILVDAIEHRLPNVLTGPIVIAGLPVLTAVSWSTGWGSPTRALLGLVLFGGWMLILALTGAGAGDVKFAAGVGLWLGWMSWAAFVTGVVVAMIAMAATELTNRHIRGRLRSPLGPAIGLGMLSGIAIGTLTF